MQFIGVNFKLLQQLPFNKIKIIKKKACFLINKDSMANGRDEEGLSITDGTLKGPCAQPAS